MHVTSVNILLHCRCLSCVDPRSRGANEHIVQSNCRRRARHCYGGRHRILATDDGCKRDEKFTANVIVGSDLS